MPVDSQTQQLAQLMQALKQMQVQQQMQQVPPQGAPAIKPPMPQNMRAGPSGGMGDLGAGLYPFTTPQGMIQPSGGVQQGPPSVNGPSAPMLGGPRPGQLPLPDADPTGQQAQTPLPPDPMAMG